MAHRVYLPFHPSRPGEMAVEGDRSSEVDEGRPPTMDQSWNRETRILASGDPFGYGNGVLACWSRFAQFQNLPGGVPATTFEGALPSWPWDRHDVHDINKNREA